MSRLNGESSKTSEDFFSNNIDKKVTINPLVDCFRSNSIVFLLFPSLNNYSRIITKPIYNILNLFILEHGLHKLNPLRPILEAVKLLSFTLIVVIFVCHFAELKEDKNVILLQQKRKPDFII